jgi:hypothetical protein
MPGYTLKAAITIPNPAKRWSRRLFPWIPPPLAARAGTTHAKSTVNELMIVFMTSSCINSQGCCLSFLMILIAEDVP